MYFFLISIAALVFFIVIAYLGLPRLGAVVIQANITLTQAMLAYILYYEVPGANWVPTSELWYIPALVGLACLVMTVFTALDPGRPDPGVAMKTGLLRWLAFVGYLLVPLIGLVACLLAIYEADSIASPPSLEAGLIWLLVCVAIGSLLFYLFSTGSRVTTWWALGSLFFCSPAFYCLVPSLILIYAVPPDAIPYPGLAAWGSLGVLPVSLVIWGINRKRVIAGKALFDAIPGSSE